MRCPVPLDADWHLDLTRVSDEDAARALLLWTNEPGQPDRRGRAAAARSPTTVRWARARGIVVAGDECYAEFAGGEPTTVLAIRRRRRARRALALEALEHGRLPVRVRRGDPDLVRYLGEVRKHAGLMTPAPIQAAAVAALGDDTHVAAQRSRYAERRALMVAGLAGARARARRRPAPFYLWLRSEEHVDDGWELAARLAEAGTLVAPGSLYGPAGADHVRLALTQPLDRLQLVLERLSAVD